MGSHADAKELATGHCIPLIVRNETRLTALHQRNDYELNYQLVDGTMTRTLVKTSLSKVGSIYTKTSIDGKSCILVTEVAKWPTGTHEITARGEVKVKNSMATPVQIKMDGIEKVLGPSSLFVFNKNVGKGGTDGLF